MFKFVFATIAVLIAGCAAHSGPIIDTKGVDLLAYEQDLAECQTISRQIRTEIGVAKGTAAGAAVGGATGAISGNAARGGVMARSTAPPSPHLRANATKARWLNAASRAAATGY